MTTGLGITGRHYRRGLPPGVKRKEGDIYIAKGTAYKLIVGNDGKYALRDLTTSFESDASFDRTLSMIHVAPGERITIGEVAWDVISLVEDTVTVGVKTPQSTQVREVKALELSKEIQAAMDTVAQAASYRAGLRETVLRHLQAASVDYISLAYDTDRARDGIIVNGIGKDDVPETLTLLAELPEAVVVTLKPAEDEATDTHTDVPSEDPHMNSDLPPVLVQLTPEKTKGEIEIKTLVQHLDESENAFSIPTGWKILDITVAPYVTHFEKETVQALLDHKSGTPFTYVPPMYRFVTITRLGEG